MARSNRMTPRFHKLHWRQSVYPEGANKSPGLAMQAKRPMARLREPKLGSG